MSNINWFQGNPITPEGEYREALICWGPENKVSKAAWLNEYQIYNHEDDRYIHDGNEDNDSYTGWFLLIERPTNDTYHSREYVFIDDSDVHCYAHVPESPF